MDLRRGDRALRRRHHDHLLADGRIAGGVDARYGGHTVVVGDDDTAGVDLTAQLLREVALLALAGDEE